MGDATAPGRRETEVAGRWSALLARAAWLATTALTLLVVAAAWRPFAAALRTPCVPALSCVPGQPSAALAEALARRGLSLDLYAGYVLAHETAYAAGFCLIAAVLATRGARDRLARTGAVTLVAFGMNFTSGQYALVAAQPGWRWPVTLLGFLGSAGLLTFFYLFPDGRFAPRWTRPAAAAWVALCALGFFTPDDFPLNQTPDGDSLFPFAALGFVSSVVAAQVWRYRRATTPAGRQQIKWVASGFAGAFAAVFAGVAPGAFGLLRGEGGALVAPLLEISAFYAGLLLLPLAIGVAVLRYRLWDIDLVINRALVYAALTAAVAGLYALLVGGASLLLRTDDDLLVPLVATGLVAVAFQPLRARLQRGVNRLLYGERDDPYAVLSRLGQRLEATLAPEAVLPAVARTVTEAFRAPWAAVALRDGDGDAVVATAGAAPGVAPVGALRLPLVYGGEPVGALLVAPRGPGETFSAGDRRLLDDLARQASVAAHAVRLTADLRRSRERLVAAREEERRRLRRDLHDGLGPQLASQALTIDAARALMARDPAAADALLRDLKAQTQSAVADIRRLVYDLRPPALDDLGLVPALREAAARLARTGLQIAVDAPEPLPSLPAAVEVAAYRIAQEALTNAVRHSGARECAVRLAVGPNARPDESLLQGAGRVNCSVGSPSFPASERVSSYLEGVVLEIADDGRGLPTERRPGIGLTSMRERAEELGGTCAIGPRPGGGTVVRAWLPLGEGTGGGRPARYGQPAERPS